MLQITYVLGQECLLKTTADDLANSVYLSSQAQFAGLLIFIISLNNSAETERLTLKILNAERENAVGLKHLLN